LKFVLAQPEDQNVKRSRFMEEQIIGILNEHEAGVSVSDLCRKLGVSNASIYKWKAKFGGMDVSEAKRLQAPEDENGKLKRMLAPLTVCKQTVAGQGMPCWAVWR
jgi:putative transposase